MRRYIKSSSDDKLQEAIDLINDYLRYEFSDQYASPWQDPEPYEGKVKPTDDLSDVGLMYTTYGGNNEVDMQVSADLLNPSIKFYINNELRDTWAYDSLDQLISEILSTLNWDDLYSWIVDYVTDDDYDPEYSSDYMKGE